MYTLTVDDNNLYIPEERDYSLNSAKIKINSDRVAYLDFEIPITNKAYDLLNEKTSMVKVYKDNVLTYKFFIDTIEDDFYYNRSVSCTSVVEYLSDSMVRPYSTIESEPGLLAPSSLDGYFQWLIDQHNAVCDTKKKFYVGVNQGASLDNNNYVYRASTQTPTVSSEIKDKILTPYPSAYITVSFDGEKNIINLYSDIYDKNEQLIDFGVNLLDFVKTADYSKCYTAVRPTGSTPEESEGNSSKLPITIESIPDGVSKWSSDVYKKQDVVYSISGVNKWGYKECAYSNSDIKTVDSLYQTSVVYLNKISSPALTIEVKAIDLSLLMGDKYSPLKVGQAVRIRSAPHNIDTYMTVSSIDIDVLDPTNDLYTLGESYDSLTGQQSAYVTRLNASINSAVDVIGSASDAASKLAEAASKKAQEAKEKANTAKSTADTVKNDLANLSIGGRNLLRETGNPYTVTGAGASSHNQVIIPYSLVTGLSTFKGKYLTMSFHIASTENASGKLMIQSAGPGFNHLFGIPTDIDLSKVGTSGIDIIGVAKYSTNDNGYQIRLDKAVGKFTFTKMKLELGNKPTDWSPAPEDYSTTTEMQSSINQTAESIKSTVAATYVNNETLSSYATKSQLEQTSTSLTSRIQTTEKSVSGMSTTVKQVNNYMTFASEGSDPTLTIGSSSSSFRTKLTNTSEKFMQGSQTIMELDGVTSTVKTSRVQMGHYQWRDTGTSMQLVYIP